LAKSARKLLCLDAKGENYIVEVDLSGMNREDIYLSIHEGIIYVLADLAFHGHLHFLIKVDSKKRNI